MPCCGHHAIPKTSILGTKYFAHRVKAKCSSLNGESREHQFLKYLACKTLHGKRPLNPTFSNSLIPR